MSLLLQVQVSGQQLFIHTDREVYFPGDTVWFKAYCHFEGHFDEDVKNLYINSFSFENKDKKVIFDAVQYIDRCVSMGQFIIPSSYNSEDLFLQAVTKRNVDKPEFHFYKKLTILQDSVAKQSSNTSSIADAAAMAYTIGHESNSIVSVDFDHDSLKSWIVLSPLKTNIDTVSIDIVAIDRETISLKQKLGTDPVFIPIDPSYTGLYKVIIKQSETIIASKDYYRNTSEKLWLKPEVYFTIKSNAPQAKNEVEIIMYPPVETNLSISITDAEVPTDSVQTIFHYLKIHPYLEESAPNIAYRDKAQLNTLLLKKNGLIRIQEYTLKSSIKDSTLYLRGQLIPKMPWLKYWDLYQKQVKKSTKNKKPVRGIALAYRKLNDSTEHYLESFYDPMGNFEVKNVVFVDTFQIKATQIYERLKFEDFKIDYTFRDIDVPAVNEVSLSKLKDKKLIVDKVAANFNADYYIQPNGMRILKPVTVFKEVDLKLKRMGNYLSKDWFSETPSILDIDVQNDMDKPNWISSVDDYMEYIYNKHPGLRGLRPITLYNNIHYTNYESKGAYRPSSIDEIKLIRIYKNYPRHPNGSGAVIMIYADMYGRNMNGGQFLNFAKIAGYNSTLPFYSPQYDTLLSTVENAYDDRLTLYWNPNINLDSNSPKSTITFYNNTKTKAYRVVIQGLTIDGDVVYYNGIHVN